MPWSETKDSRSPRASTSPGLERHDGRARGRAAHLLQRHAAALRLPPLDSYADREAAASVFSAGIGIPFGQGMFSVSAGAGQDDQLSSHQFPYPADYLGDQFAADPRPGSRTRASAWAWADTLNSRTPTAEPAAPTGGAPGEENDTVNSYAASCRSCGPGRPRRPPAARAAERAADDGLMRLHLIWTNDIHGHIAPEAGPVHESGVPAARWAAAPRRPRYIKDVRAEAAAAGEPVLLVDVGDIFQGTPIGNKTQGDGGDRVLQRHRLRLRACRATTTSTWAARTSSACAGMSDFPLLCANLRGEDDRQDRGLVPADADARRAGREDRRDRHHHPGHARHVLPREHQGPGIPAHGADRGEVPGRAEGAGRRPDLPGHPRGAALSTRRRAGRRSPAPSRDRDRRRADRQPTAATTPTAA